MTTLLDNTVSMILVDLTLSLPPIVSRSGIVLSKWNKRLTVTERWIVVLDESNLLRFSTYDLISWFVRANHTQQTNY